MPDKEAVRGCACSSCEFMLRCLAWWCAFHLYRFAAFLHNLERLAGLKCSIVQCRVQPDGFYLIILTTTSSMGQHIRVWNGFGSMYRASGIQSPRTPWDHPRRIQPFIGNGARSITLKCIGRGKVRMALPRHFFTTGPVSYAIFYTWYYRDWITRGYQRLGRPRPSIARPVYPSSVPDLMYAGLTSSSASSNSHDN